METIFRMGFKFSFCLSFCASTISNIHTGFIWQDYRASSIQYGNFNDCFNGNAWTWRFENIREVQELSMITFENIIDKVLEHEGGYVNDPYDKGGETKYGIAKRWFPELDN